MVVPQLLCQLLPDYDVPEEPGTGAVPLGSWDYITGLVMNELASWRVGELASWRVGVLARTRYKE